MKTPECHPGRAYQAKGLCAQCYYKQYDDARRAVRNATKRKSPVDYASNYRRPPTKVARIPDCHPDEPHAAHGMCRKCYAKGGAARATCHPEKRLVANGLCSACYSKRRYDRDPETARRQTRESQARTRKRTRDALVEAYGGKCACARCPETNTAFLTLEHADKSGKQHRAEMGSHTYADLRRRGFPQEGYTLLCWNCNALTRFGKPCPHESEE